MIDFCTLLSDFLKKSGICTYIKQDISNISINAGGGISERCETYINLFGSNPYQDLLLSLFVAFEAIDSHFESSNPHIVNLGFEEKIKKINKKNWKDIRLLNLYRFLLRYRNGMIHHKDMFSIKHEKLNIKYTTHSDNYDIVVYIASIHDICTVTIMLISKNTFSLYEKMLINCFFDDMANDFIVLKNGVPLKLCNIRVKLRTIHRLKYEVKNYIIYNDNIEFMHDIAIQKQESERWRHIDYCFSIENDNYIVPYEALDLKLKIKKSYLRHFKV